MISKKTSGRYSLMSYIPAVLTVMALFIGFSCSDEQEVKQEVKEIKQGVEITSLDQINPNTIKSITLKKEQDLMIITLKDGNEINLKIGDVLSDNTKEYMVNNNPNITTNTKEGTFPANGDEEVFVVVEDMPQFPGGVNALKKFIGNNVKYPKEAHKKGIDGRVFVGFVVDEEGNVTRVKVLRPVDPLLDAEAIRVVQAMPQWKPGKQKGKPVKVSYTIPINFALK